MLFKGEADTNRLRDAGLTTRMTEKPKVRKEKEEKLDKSGKRSHRTLGTLHSLLFDMSILAKYERTEDAEFRDRETVESPTHR